MATRTLPSRLRPRCRVSNSTSRKYHSYDHPPPPGPFSPIESTILAAALPHIPSSGFTLTSLSLGAKDAGYVDASVNLFPKGAFSLVHYYLLNQRLRLRERDGTKAVMEGEGGVGRKLKGLTWERLMANKEVVHRWQEVRSHPCFQNEFSAKEG